MLLCEPGVGQAENVHKSKSFSREVKRMLRKSGIIGLTENADKSNSSFRGI